MKSKLLLAAASSLLLAVTALAADVSGKWTAESQGRDGQTRTTTFNFKVEGEALSGTISGMQGETPISDGTVKGEDLAFNVVMNFNGNEMKMMYKGKIAGDEIKMTRTREGGNGPGQEMTARRAK